MTHQHCSVREIVAGSVREPEDTLPGQLSDSDTGDVLHAQMASSSETVQEALAAAWALHTTEAWTGLPTTDRAALLRRFQAELTARIGDLAAADSLDTGVPLHWTRALVSGRVGMLGTAAELLDEGFERTEHAMAIGAADQWKLPWGPVAIFLPWNAPAPTVITKIGDALVAGCPVIVKPSEWAPHFSGPLAEAIAASLPASLVQIVHGDHRVGSSLVTDDRIGAVSYTGGVTGGRAVAEACATQFKPVDLELSGNNPVLALPDADGHAVVSEVVFGLQLLNGQVCVGPRRLVVPSGQLQSYLDALETALGGVVIGASTDPSTTLGPMAHEGHLAHLRRQIHDLATSGCEVREYGQLPDGRGHFLRPTVIVANKGADSRTEIFGPVLIVRTYDDIDEAVAVANDHPYGLVAYVFGADRDRARAVGRRLRAGLVTVNAVLNSEADAPAIGSMWGSSGLGSVGAGQGPAFFTGHRFVG